MCDATALSEHSLQDVTRKPLQAASSVAGRVGYDDPQAKRFDRSGEVGVDVSMARVSIQSA